jgi:transforming growth factor-beta-induced protein
MKKWIALTLATLAVMSMAFAGTARKQGGDIVDTAIAAGSFKTLVAAVQAAGLVDALKGHGPFTVFAPTDAAFEKLEQKKPGTIAMLLKPENKAKLTAILTYHVVSGKVLAADVLGLKNGTKVKTLNGKSITVHNKHGVRVDKATVVETDIVCTNGVIHVIDTVLLP